MRSEQRAWLFGSQTRRIFTTLGYRDHEIDYDRNTGIPTSQSTSAIKWDKVVCFCGSDVYAVTQRCLTRVGCCGHLWILYFP